MLSERGTRFATALHAGPRNPGRSPLLRVPPVPASCLENNVAINRVFAGLAMDDGGTVEQPQIDATHLTRGRRSQRAPHGCQPA
jgi:hypothetical protein